MSSDNETECENCQYRQAFYFLYILYLLLLAFVLWTTLRSEFDPGPGMRQVLWLVLGIGIMFLISLFKQLIDSHPPANGNNDFDDERGDDDNQ